MPRHPLIEQALALLQSQVREADVAASPQAVKDYLSLLLGDRPHEVFVVLFLDAQNRVIATEEMFRGTLTQTCVYPREVVLAVLTHNAAAVILAHNHPSGLARPSRVDEEITHKLRMALELIDVKVLDHVIVAGRTSFSMAEHGML